MRNLARTTLVTPIGFLCTVCGLLLTSASATATPVNGTVFFEGSFEVNARVFGAATRFNSFSGVTVTAGNGLYADVPVGTPVSMVGFSYLSFAPVDNQWEFSFDGNTYSFDLNSVHIDSQSRAVLVLSGTGIAHITGSDPTPGTWTLTANGNTETFTAEFDPPYGVIVVGVPDGGATTFGLLGLASLSLGLLRRIAARKS